MPPSVTVLIAARDEELTLPATLSSLADQSRRPEAVIVVDDGSSDATAEVAERWGAHVIRLPHSRGRKSAAQDAALASVTTDLIVTVDADTVLAPDALERLTAAFDGAQAPGATCGYVLPRRIRSVWERGRLVEYLFGQAYYKSVQSSCRSVLVTSGCLACYPADLIRERGGFRSRLLTEDMDVTTWITTSASGRDGPHAGATFVADAFAYTIDPPDLRRYTSQLGRWYAGFFQNAKLHGRALARWRAPMVSLFVLSLLIDALLAVGAYVAVPVVGLWRHWEWQAWVHLSLVALAIEMMVVGTVSSWSALRIWRRQALIPGPAPGTRARYGGSLHRLLANVALSLPCYVVASVVNRITFFAAFFREVLGPLVRLGPRTAWGRPR